MDTARLPSAPLLTRAERHAQAKAMRATVPRESLADLTLPPDRDALAILDRQARHRIPFLVPERERRMAANSFAFLRGAAAVMAADFATAPRTGLLVQAAGDCHIMNFGSFISPEGRILFDINDFDETIAGVEFHVDVRRMVASLAVAASDAGLGKKHQRKTAAAAARAYRERMRELAKLSPYQVWQQRVDLSLELDRIEDKRLRHHIASALRRLPADQMVDDDIPHLDPASSGTRFQDRDGTIFHGHNPETQALVSEAAAAFAQYPSVLPPERRHLLACYAHVDTAIKVVGVGSVGTLCAIALYLSPDGDMLVLQLKEAQSSVNIDLVADPALLTTGDEEGKRVVEGQHALQAATDVFLNWIPVGSHPAADKRRFYVRHLKTQRLSSLADFIASDIHEADALIAYGELCARTLARAHARTGDPISIAAYLGSSTVFDDSLAAFSTDYVAINAADWARLNERIGRNTTEDRSGRSGSHGSAVLF